ncbi:MAG: DUF2341 domain-containing protein [Deltaproteobacteria bacterium]|nr:DUF2341 domain-containing protein [Deltaproteobacteria bacterium]
MAWLAGWKYRKLIPVSHASGALTNYQKRLLVGESSGAAGADIHCEGLCLSSFADLRLTPSDGQTLLDYYIESITGTTPNRLASVVIEYDTIGVSSTPFYLYFGNSNASSASNAANTYIIYDDFERGADGDTISSPWVESVSHVHISTERAFAGTRSMKHVGAVGAGGAANLTLQAASDIAIQERINRDEVEEIYPLLFFNGAKCTYPIINKNNYIYYYSGGIKYSTGAFIGLNTWFLFELRNFNWTAGTFDIVLNGTVIKTGAAMYNSNYLSNAVRNTMYSVSNTTHYWIDNFIARKWTAIEPVYGAFGSLETRGIARQAMHHRRLRAQ